MPLLGLFKERSEGAGHSFGTTAVRGFAGMTEEETAEAMQSSLRTVQRDWMRARAWLLQAMDPP